MREQFTESPFRDVREGRPWRYQGRQRVGPEPRDRSLLVTVLALGMLTCTALMAPFTIRLLPMLLYLVMLGASSPIFQDLLLKALGLLAGALIPFVLPIVMAVGLLRHASWARTWAIVMLPIILVLGGGVVGLYYWTQINPHMGGPLNPTNRTVIEPLAWYALAMTPLTIAMLIGLTRPQVIEEMKEDGNVK